MNRNTLIVLALAVLVIILGAFIFWPKSQSQNTNLTGIIGDSGIIVITPKENDIVSSPLTITGMVTGNGWNGFEGQVGTVKLMGAEGNVLALGVLTATSDWMTFPVNFSTTLNFTDSVEGVQSLVFKNENASGDPAKDKTFTLLLKSKNSIDYQNNLNGMGK